MYARALDNPILIRELRACNRGKIVFASQLGYLVLLGLVVIGARYAANGNQAALRDGWVGTVVFFALQWAQLPLVGLLTLSLAAGALTSEKENNTLDALYVSTLSARALTWGKLGSVLLRVYPVVLLSLPYYALAYAFGGVSLPTILWWQAWTLAAIPALAAITLAISVPLRHPVHVVAGAALSISAAVAYLGAVAIMTLDAPCRVMDSDWPELSEAAAMWATLGVAVVGLGIVTAVFVTLTSCAIRRQRDGHYAWQPRAILVGFGAILSASLAPCGVAEALWLALVACLVLALFMTGDQHSAAQPNAPRWYQVWLDSPTSAPLFVLLWTLLVCRIALPHSAYAQGTLTSYALASVLAVMASTIALGRWTKSTAAARALTALIAVSLAVLPACRDFLLEVHDAAVCAMSGLDYYGPSVALRTITGLPPAIPAVLAALVVGTWVLRRLTRRRLSSTPASPR